MPSKKQNKPVKPSRYEQYELEWRHRSLEELQQEFEHQDSVVTGNIAGTGIAALAVPLTMGLSLVAIGGTGPALHIARKKRAIVGELMKTKQEGPSPIALQPINPNRSSESLQLPAYTPEPILKPIGEPLPAPREKEVYNPEPQIDGPPSYTEAASAAIESSSRLNFHQPTSYLPSQAVTETNPFFAATQMDSRLDEPVVGSIDSQINSLDYTSTSNIAQPTRLERSTSRASSLYDEHESPLISLDSSPVSPLTPLGPTVPVQVQNVGVMGHGVLVQGSMVSRYNSIAVQNPFASPADPAPVRKTFHVE